jgi:pilus assembly protein CpaE
MWTAAIAGSDYRNASELRACLQQTGLVGSVAEWDINLSQDPQKVSATEVVLLSLNGNPSAELAFATGLRRANPNVRIIAYSPAKQPDSEFLLHAMRSGVQEVLSSPLTVEVLQEALTRFNHAASPAERNSLKRLILVMGSKGGVGTSTIAVNLGVQFVRITHRRVCLLDFARPIGHIALMLDLQSRFTLRDATGNSDRLDHHYFGGLLAKHKSGLEVLPGLTRPEEWQQVSPVALSGLVSVAQSACDYVVIDYGTVHSFELLSNAAFRMAPTILLVAESNVPSLWTLERHVAGLAAIGLDLSQIRIVINRWTKADDDALKSLERKLKRPIFARIPNDFRQVSEAVNLGTPLGRNASNPLVSQLCKLATQLGAVSSPPPKREGLSGLFSFRKRG